MGISAKLLNAVGLKGFEQSYPRQLSGGMRQRVALARTLAIRPQVLLLDEPLGAIDYVVRMQLQRDLEDLWSAENWTVLYVTHDPMEAVVLSDRILVLSSRPGIIVHQMTPDLPRPRQRSDPQVIRVWEMLVQALTDSSEGEDV
jgi:NitT/TauT family transport system ATP-binding protein